jgi:hypothetical protein
MSLGLLHHLVISKFGVNFGALMMIAQLDFWLQLIN